jgi:hypothetical protein
MFFPFVFYINKFYFNDVYVKIKFTCINCIIFFKESQKFDSARGDDERVEWEWADEW